MGVRVQIGVLRAAAIGIIPMIAGGYPPRPSAARAELCTKCCRLKV